MRQLKLVDVNKEKVNTLWLFDPNGFFWTEACCIKLKPSSEQHKRMLAKHVWVLVRAAGLPWMTAGAGVVSVRLEGGIEIRSLVVKSAISKQEW